MDTKPYASVSDALGDAVECYKANFGLAIGNFFVVMLVFMVLLGIPAVAIIATLGAEKWQEPVVQIPFNLVSPFLSTPILATTYMIYLDWQTGRTPTVFPLGRAFKMLPRFLPIIIANFCIGIPLQFLDPANWPVFLLVFAVTMILFFGMALAIPGAIAGFPGGEAILKSFRYVFRRFFRTFFVGLITFVLVLAMVLVITIPFIAPLLVFLWFGWFRQCAEEAGDDPFSTVEKVFS